MLNPVSDLKLGLNYTRSAGAGALELNLSKRRDVFTARLLPDAVELLRADVANPQDRTVLAHKSWNFGPRSARVELVNVDYRVRLLVDGQEVLSTTPQQYAPDVEMLRRENTMPRFPSVSIQAQNQVAIAKASLDKAQSDFNRYQSLYNQGAVAAATLDIYRTQLDVAKSQYNNALQAASIVEEGARWRWSGAPPV
jgi:hypothetical protein